MIMQSSSSFPSRVKRSWSSIMFIGFTLLNCRSLFVLDKLTRPWDAAKHMESAAALAKDLSNWKEVADFYRKAAELYMECGRPQPASDALAKGAR